MMQSALSHTQFQTQPSFGKEAPNENLARAKSLGNSAWKQFSSMVDSAQSRSQPASLGRIQPEQNPEQAQQQQQSMAQRLNQLGFNDNVPRSLITNESGGNYRAANDETGSSGRDGHFGILQFGHDRLDDVRRAGVIPQGMTPEQFMASRDAQIAASNWHFNDIDNRIRKNGYDQYIGQTIGGTPITMNGMRSMAHLGGFGGLSKFIKSGGQYNPSDSFGTSLAAYGRTHSQ